MKISYTVKLGEVFYPVKECLGPANYDPDKHDVYCNKSNDPIPYTPTWITGYNYRLELKKVRTSKFYAYPSKGLPVYVSSLEVAWNWLWYGGKATKFVVEHVYEDDILIDMIVHKDPKG